MVFFNIASSASGSASGSTSGSLGGISSTRADPRGSNAGSAFAASGSASPDQCPVDHETRSKWLAANPEATPPHPLAPSSEATGSGSTGGPSQARTSGPGQPRTLTLSHDRVVSSIPRAPTSYPSPEGSVPHITPSPSSPLATDGEQENGKWVYPSEHQFFQALSRKNHNPSAGDMRTVVPIHNAVNERTWEEVLAWEAGMGGENCGGIRLISFSGRPKDMTPKAWFKTLAGYAPPFDRHDWLVDRCGTTVRYVIDYYSGKPDPSRPGSMAFHLDVRPALDSWDGIKTRMTGMWR